MCGAHLGTPDPRGCGNQPIFSVHNVLCRAELLRTKHGKPSRPDFPRVQRPAVEAPGDLVEIDTIHLGTKSSGGRLCYVYTLVDLKTRWAYAEVHARQEPLTSVAFVGRAQAFPSYFQNDPDRPRLRILQDL